LTLEGVLSGEPWQKLARVRRSGLLLAIEEREKRT
jgi:hypothetical protein